MKTIADRAVLVYQAGIANVFRVECFNLATYGRDAALLMQSSFGSCESFCHGLEAAGAIVRVAYCNEAGNIVDQNWSDDREAAPFCESFAFTPADTTAWVARSDGGA